jgi:hypothetical protein
MVVKAFVPVGTPSGERRFWAWEVDSEVQVADAPRAEFERQFDGRGAVICGPDVSRVTRFFRKMHDAPPAL